MNKTLIRLSLLCAVLAPLGAQAQSSDVPNEQPLPPPPVNQVPEPGSMALAALALAASAGLRARRAARRRD